MADNVPAVYDGLGRL